MSIKCVRKSLEVKGLTITSKLLLVTLASHMGKNKNCWPTIRKLEELVGVTRRVIFTHLSILEEKGLIKRELREAKNGSKLGNYYYIAYHSAAPGSVSQEHQEVLEEAPPNKGIKKDKYKEQYINIDCSNTEIYKAPSLFSASRRPTPKKRKCDFPDDFEVTDEHRELADKLKVELFAERDKFKDYNLAKGNQYIDWNAAFRNWLRNAAKFARPSQAIGFVKPESEREKRDRQMKEDLAIIYANGGPVFG